jgi:Zn-dependent protease
VLAQEPPRSPYDLNFSLLGIPVRVHPFFWLVALVLGWGLQDPRRLLLWVAVCFVSILVHELGHALAIRYYGWAPYIILYSFGGLACYNQGIGSYGSARRRGHSTAAQIIISAAGPGAGFALAAVVAASLYATHRYVAFPFVGEIGRGEPIAEEQLYNLVSALLSVNIFWGLINLFPVYPLDGGQIARAILTSFDPRDGLRHSFMLSCAMGAGLALFGLSQREYFLALLFGYLAYSSYQSLQGYSGGGFGQGPW